jgi:hypothetical protein
MNFKPWLPVTFVIAKALEKAMEDGRGGKCLSTLALPKDMDDLAGRCPAERTWDHGAVLSRRYKLKCKFTVFHSACASIAIHCSSTAPCFPYMQRADGTLGRIEFS